MPSRAKKLDRAVSNLPSIPKELVAQFLTGPMTGEAINAAGIAFKQALIEASLNAELTHHLGYAPGADRPAATANQRNGVTAKTVLTGDGKMRIKTPRDREGSFEPLLLPKHARRFTAFDDSIVALYARGLTVREIQGYLAESYGTEVSPDLISTVTDGVLAEVTAWQARPLETVYPVVFFDALRVKVREDNVVRNKAVYLALGVRRDGSREILGLWIETTEGAKFWMHVLNDIKNRGAEDILIACVDGLKGFPEAVKAIYPAAEVQVCIVHQIRNTMKFVPHKDKKKFCEDLKPVYAAPTEEAGGIALKEMEERWPQYRSYLKSWETRWADLTPYFAYPEPIRRMIYTTNAIENLNRQFRKVTKTTTVFPHDDALLKLLWLAQADIARTWSLPVRHWGEVMAQLAILFPDRVQF